MISLTVSGVKNMEENNVELSEVLKELNLTDYEIKAYVILLRMGPLTAEKVSDMAGIPLPRVYDTITSLQHKGFVLVSKTRPKKFKPVEAPRALGTYSELKRKEINKSIDEFEKRATRAASALSKIVPERPQSDEKWEVWVAERRSNRIKMIQELSKIAQNDLLIFSGDLSWIHDDLNLMKNLKKKGINVRILVKDPLGNKQIFNNIKTARSLGAKVKAGYSGTIRGQIVDNKTAVIVTKLGRFSAKPIDTGMPGSDDVFTYEIMSINNPTIASLMRENFEFWWNKLK